MNDMSELKRIGRNVEHHRERLGWTQTELARRMNALGWNTYSASTVGRTEKAQRPLRLDEGAALAQVLGIDLNTLVYSTDEEHQLAQIKSHISELEVEHHKLSNQTQAVLGARRRLNNLSSDMDHEKKEPATNALSEYTVWQALANAVEDYAERRPVTDVDSFFSPEPTPLEQALEDNPLSHVVEEVTGVKESNDYPGGNNA